MKFEGWFQDDDWVFMAMEYFEHGDLRQCVSSPLPEAEAKMIIFQVTEGLSKMHESGFAHRDIKSVVGKRKGSLFGRWLTCVLVIRRTFLLLISRRTGGSKLAISASPSEYVMVSRPYEHDTLAITLLRKWHIYQTRGMRTWSTQELLMCGRWVALHIGCSRGRRRSRVGRVSEGTVKGEPRSPWRP